MKRTKTKQRLPSIIADAVKAMNEAVAEVYDEAARTGRPLAMWDDEKKKVVRKVPKLKPRKNGRSARARRNGKK